MFETSVKRQMGFFGDISSIKPKPDVIRKMMDVLKKWDLVPGTSQEVQNPFSSPTSILTMSQPEVGLEIYFGTRRFDIFRNAIDAKGSNVEDFELFANLGLEIGSEIAGAFSLKFQRLSNISEYMLEEMTDEKLLKVYNEIFRKTPNVEFENLPFEWLVRTNVKKSYKSLNRIEETNSIVQLEKVKAIIEQRNIKTEVDRIHLLIDINTSQEDQEYRFSADNIGLFLNFANTLHNEISTTLIELKR